jgi:nucleoside-diphosphate-sugar epimerase
VNFSTDKTYLIVGANGFIGNAMCNLLKQSNVKTKILVRHKLKNSIHKQFIFKSIKDINSDIFADVDIVVFLVGMAHDLASNYNASEYRKVNVNLTADFAKIAARNNVKRFIFISSVKASGNLYEQKSLDENNQIDPKNIYGKTKREAEVKLLNIESQTDMEVIILRPTLVYGPNQKGNLELMLLGIKRGWFPPLPETGNKRSMVHIDNLVEAIFFVSTNNHVNGEIFIVTDKNPYSSHKIYNVMRYIAGKKELKWSVPEFLFSMAALISPHIRYKINKLLGSECYSSEKLEKLGFKAKKNIQEMNETSF